MLRYSPCNGKWNTCQLLFHFLHYLLAYVHWQTHLYYYHFIIIHGQWQIDICTILSIFETPPNIYNKDTYIQIIFPHFLVISYFLFIFRDEDDNEEKNNVKHTNCLWLKITSLCWWDLVQNNTHLQKLIHLWKKFFFIHVTTKFLGPILILSLL